MDKVRHIYCDSNVFLAYFKGEVGRVGIVESLIDEVRGTKELRLLSSLLSVTEVAHTATLKSRSVSDLEAIEALDSFWSNTSVVELSDFHIVLARRARALVRKHRGLDPRDAIHLATALQGKASELLTYDSDLLKLNDDYEFKICEPYLRRLF